MKVSARATGEDAQIKVATAKVHAARRGSREALSLRVPQRLTRITMGLLAERQR